MRLGVDFVALAIVGAAFIFGQIRTVPAKLRFFVMAAAFGIVAGWRFKNGGFSNQVNILVIGLSIAFCLNYLVKGLRYRPPPVD